VEERGEPAASQLPTLRRLCLGRKRRICPSGRPIDSMSPSNENIHSTLQAADAAPAASPEAAPVPAATPPTATDSAAPNAASLSNGPMQVPSELNTVPGSTKLHQSDRKQMDIVAAEAAHPTKVASTSQALKPAGAGSRSADPHLSRCLSLAQKFQGQICQQGCF